MATKPYRRPHFGRAHNRHTFAQAYRKIKANRNKIHRALRTDTPFVPVSTKAKYGKHKGEKVIIFLTDGGEERARSYACCWGHITNCNRTYIDRFSGAI